MGHLFPFEGVKWTELLTRLPQQAISKQALSLPFEDIQYGGFMQPFLESHLLSRRFVLHSFVDVHLEDPGLPSFGINPLQTLCKGFATYMAIKAPLRKMHQRFHSPDIQVTYTTLLSLVNFIRHFQTTRAYGHIMFMFAEQVQILFLVLFLNGKSSDSHSGQTQQITQGFRCHGLRRR